jgi:hypothetical protein
MKIFNATFLMGLALFISLSFESQATTYTSAQIVSDPPDDTY